MEIFQNNIKLKNDNIKILNIRIIYVQSDLMMICICWYNHDLFFNHAKKWAIFHNGYVFHDDL
jgi:hypothetical protein